MKLIEKSFQVLIFFAVLSLLVWGVLEIKNTYFFPGVSRSDFFWGALAVVLMAASCLFLFGESRHSRQYSSGGIMRLVGQVAAVLGCWFTVFVVASGVETPKRFAERIRIVQNSLDDYRVVRPIQTAAPWKKQMLFPRQHEINFLVTKTDRNGAPVVFRVWVACQMSEEKATEVVETWGFEKIPVPDIKEELTNSRFADLWDVWFLQSGQYNIRCFVDVIADEWSRYIRSLLGPFYSKVTCTVSKL